MSIALKKSMSGSSHLVRAIQVGSGLKKWVRNIFRLNLISKNFFWNYHYFKISKVYLIFKLINNKDFKEHFVC